MLTARAAGRGRRHPTDNILITIDMADPTRPRGAGRYWLHGINLAAGETPDWPAERRYGLHDAIVHGATAYGAWRDAGLVMIDVADRSRRPVPP